MRNKIKAGMLASILTIIGVINVNAQTNDLQEGVELTHDNTSGESFDLQGRPASRSSKGIHISNGHKYIKE